MSCNRNNEDSIRDTLEDNVGKGVIIFTNCGGRAGNGFRGVVASVNEDTVRLITSLPTVPENPLDDDAFDDFRSDCCDSRDPIRCCRERNRRRRFRFGSVVVIPIVFINCVVVNEV